MDDDKGKSRPHTPGEPELKMVAKGQETRYLWEGEMLTPSQLYARGCDDEYQRSLRSNRSSVKTVTDEIKSMILGASQTREDQPEPTWWPSFQRAAAHIVYDPTGAPVGAGKVQVTPEPLPPTLVETWISDSFPALRYTRMFESEPPNPIPPLPAMSTLPTAGARAGEKIAMYSKAFDITAATATEIDAGLYLNISEVLVDQGFMPLVNMIMKSAVVAEASKQIAQAVETAAAAGGMANFAGRFVPSVVVVPPKNVATIAAANFVAAGMTIVIDPSVTKTLVVDPNAIIGWFRQGRMEQFEPSVDGTGVSFSAYGKVAVDSTGVAALP